MEEGRHPRNFPATVHLVQLLTSGELLCQFYSLTIPVAPSATNARLNYTSREYQPSTTGTWLVNALALETTWTKFVVSATCP